LFFSILVGFLPVYQRAVLKTHGNAFDISCPRAILMLPKNVISVNVFFFLPCP